MREREKSWLLRIDDQVQKSLKLSMLFICGAYIHRKKINLTFITFCVCKEALLIWKGIHHESLLLYASHISPHTYDVSDTICRCWCAMELISFLHSRFLLFSIIIKKSLLSSSRKVHQSKSLLTDPHSLSKAHVPQIYKRTIQFVLLKSWVCTHTWDENYRTFQHQQCAIEEIFWRRNFNCFFFFYTHSIA